MFYRITLKAAPDVATQLNQQWIDAGFEGTMISTKESIEREIAYLKGAGEPFASLAYVKSVEDFEKARPHLARGMGEHVIRTDDPPSSLLASRDRVRFIRERAGLLLDVAGLQDAWEALEMKAPNAIAALEAEKSVQGWDEMPVERTQLYVTAKSCDAKEFWRALVLFRDDPTDASWDRLQGLTVPVIADEDGLSDVVHAVPGIPKTVREVLKLAGVSVDEPTSADLNAIQSALENHSAKNAKEHSVANVIDREGRGLSI